MEMYTVGYEYKESCNGKIEFETVRHHIVGMSNKEAERGKITTNQYWDCNNIIYRQMLRKFILILVYNFILLQDKIIYNHALRYSFYPFGNATDFSY